jgi:glycerophosphoryl diester phosphodiesterase
VKDAGSVAKILAEIRKAAWNTDDFVITSFHVDVPSRVRSIRANVQVGLLLPLSGQDLATEARRTLQATDVDSVPDFIAPEDGAKLTWELLEECAACGMPVVPWTVNVEDRMRDLFKHPAIAGIITDYVPRARDVRKLIR